MMKFLSFFLLFSLYINTCQAALAIDGTVISTAPSLTTTSSNDVIVCFIKYTNGFPTSVSGGSLTWIGRSTHGSDPAGSIALDEWYAIAASPLSSVSITQSGATGGTKFICFGVSGANTSIPFDTNGSIPSNFFSGGVSSHTTTITTDNANDMLIGAITSNNFGTITPPSGFTNIKTSTTQSADYKIVSSTQSSVGITYSVSSNFNSMIVDAIQQAAPPASTCTNCNEMPIFKGVLQIPSSYILATGESP